MNKQRIHYRRTTASQRKFLFEVWEATRDVGEACGQARVSRRTFYYWKPRFDADGYKGLEQVQKPGTKTPNRTSSEIEEQVLGLRKAHPSWGKRRIADELAKANNWERVISPNTVRRILKDAGLWTACPKGVKKGGPHL